MNPSGGQNRTKGQGPLFDEGQLNAVNDTGALQPANSLEGDNYASIATEEAAMKQRFEAAAGTKTRGRMLKFAGLGAVLVISLVVVGIRQLHGSNTSGTSATDASVRYHNISIPLADLATDSPALSVGKAQTLSINGQLNVNNSLVLAPTARPDGAVTGQLYYDQTTNRLAYYNGSAFQTVLSGDNIVTTTIGGASGAVAAGNGLAVAGNTLSNSGVLSLQGQSGNITLAGGPGIVVNGTTLSNSGLLSLGGQNGAITLGAGLGLSGQQLRNTGVISAVGAGSITVTNDGNGNITIDGPNGSGGAGTVASPGGTSGKIAKFTGVQTIADSLISDNGIAVTVGGDLSVTGTVSLTTPLAVTSGGTGANSAAGARTNLGAAKSGANSDITSLSGLTTALSVAQGGIGVGTLATNGVLVGNGTSPLTAVVAGSANQCLVSTAGAPIWTTCPGSGGVSSLNGGTGALTLNNASLAGSAITINDATTAAKGIASFSSTNFSVTSGAVNTIQNINTTASPTFGQLTLTSSQAANPMFVVNNTNVAASGSLLDLQLNGASKFSVTPTGNITSTGTLNGQTISSSANFTGTLAVTGAINGQTISSNANFTGSVAVGTTLSVNTVTPSGALTVGATGQSFLLQGNAASSLTATNGGNTTTLAFQTPTANVTYNFPTAAAGTYNICTTVGNCAGVGGGVTTPGGTANTIAKFTAGGTIGNSSITDNGSTVTVGGTLAVNTITPTSTLTVGATGQNLTLQGATVSLTSTASGITNALTFAAPSGSNKTITVPNATGTLAVSASGPIALDAAGNLTCPTCLTSGGSGGTAGVASLNGQTGTIILQGTDAASITTVGTTITVNDATTAVKGLAKFDGTNLVVTSGAVNTAQNITVTSAPTFAGLTLTSALTVANGGTGSGTAAGARTNLGAAASGANSDITSLSGLTTALSVLQGGTGAASLTANGVLIGHGTSPVSSATGNNGDCLVVVAGAPAFTTCPGSGGVASLNSLSGTLTLNNASGSLSSITIDNAKADGTTKGIATFNGTNFSDNGSGVINTIQDIATSAAPSFGQLTITSSQAANAMMVINNTNTLASGNLIDLKLNGSSKFSVAPNGNTTVAGTLTSGLINGQTISSSANFTGSVTVGTTLTVNTITPTSSLTIGSTAQSFVLQGTGTSTITSRANGHTTTLGFTGGSPTTDPIYKLDSSAPTNTYTICTTAGNCVGTGGSVSGSGTNNRITKFTSTGSTVGDSSITDDGSNVTLNTNVNLVLQGSTAYISNPQGQSQSEAFGHGAIVGSNNATAVGYNASAANGGVAVGQGATTSSTAGVAVGASASAGFLGTALGTSAIADQQSTALGESANTNGHHESIALGYDATNTANNQFVVGGDNGSGEGEITQMVVGNGITNAAPIGFTLQATSGSGANITGADLSIASGQGTGTGNGGNINFQIAKSGSSGSALNALATIETISGTNGSVLFKNAADSTTAFQIQNTIGNSVLKIDTANGRIGINTPGAPTSALEITGSLRIDGSLTESFHTPGTNGDGSNGADVPTKINIPFFDPGNFGQIIAMGLPSSANTTARAISVLDARTGVHQPSIAVFDTSENQSFGLSWDGDNCSTNVNCTPVLKSTSSRIGLQAAGSTTATLYNTGTTAELTVGIAGARTGLLTLGNSSNVQTATLKSGVTTNSYVAILPTNVGATGQCLYVSSVSSQVETLDYTTCSGGGGGTAFLQGGNAFAATGVLGTTDNNALSIITNNATRAAFAADGSSLTLGSNMNLVLQGSSAHITNTQGQTNSEAFGASATVSGGTAVAVGGSASAVGGAVALGYNANASGLGASIAIGSSASASDWGVAIGSATTTSGNWTVAIGFGASTSGQNSVAIGNGAGAHLSSVALGSGAAANGNGSIALGDHAIANSDNQFVVGSSSAAITQAIIGNGATNVAPVGFTLQATSGSGTDITGASTTIAGGQGTGTGNGGGINFQIAKAGTTGTSQNALSTVASISGTNGSALFKNSADSATGFQIQNAAATSTVLDVDTSNKRVGIGTNAPSRVLDVVTNNSLTNAPSIKLEQQGTGDTSIEFKDANGKSFFVGQDASSGSAFKIASSTSASSNFTVGQTTLGGSVASGYVGEAFIYKVATGATGGTATSVTFYVTAVDGSNPHAKVALYSHDAANNRPGNLLASSSSQTLNTGYNTIPISATVSASTTYWIGVTPEGNSTSFNYVFNGGTASPTALYGLTYSNPWPNPAGAPFGTDNSKDWTLYLTVTPSGAVDSFAGIDLLTLTDTGALTLQNSANSTTAFQIQNAGGSSVFAVDTSGGNVNLGNNVNLLLSGTSAHISNPQGQNNSEAFGKNASVAGNHDATAIGAGASSDTYSIALGATSNASSASVAIGSGSIATGDGSLAIGKSSQSTFTGSLAIGTDSSTTAANQLVIGSWSHAITQAVIGNGVSNANPIGFTLQATSTANATSNTAGGSITIAGGQGTGTGAGGNINFQIAKSGTNGSSQNALSTVASISGANGSVLFKNAADSSTAFQIQNAAAQSLFTVNSSALAISAGSSSSIIGTTSVGGTLNSGGQNGIITRRITTSAAGTLNAISFYINSIDSTPANDNYQVAIYADSSTCAGAASSCPSTLIASSSTSTLNGFAWNARNLSASLSASTNYWIAIEQNASSNANNNTVYATTAGDHYSFYQPGLVCTGGTVGYGVWPTTLGTSCTPTSNNVSTTNLSAYASINTGSDGYAISTDNNAHVGIGTTSNNTDMVAINGVSTGSALNVTGYASIFADSKKAFSVQNAAGTSLIFEADTTNQRVYINSSFSGTNAAALNIHASSSGSNVDVLDVYNNANVTMFQITKDGTANFGNASARTGSGTISNTAGSATVTGVSTLFLSQFKVGDTITIDPSGTPASCTVATIASDTSLTCSSTITNAHGAGTAFSFTGAGSSDVASIQANGNVKLGSGSGHTVFVDTAASGSNGDALTLQAGSGNGTNKNGGNLVLQGGAATGIGTGGSVIVKDQTDSTAAFQIQNASGASFFSVDTTNERIYVGPIAGDTTGALLVLGTKTNAGDPTGTNGAMYYNSNTNTFRCYQNSAWTNCIGVTTSDSFRQQPFYSTDFFSTDTTPASGSGYSEQAYPWLGSWVNSAGQIGTVTAAVANHPGIIRMSSAAPANSGWMYETNTTAVLLSGGESFEAVFRSPGSFSNTTIRIGFLDTTTNADATDGAYLEIGPGTTTASVTGKTADGGTRSSTGTSGTVSVSLFYRVKITLNSNASTVTYALYNDGGTSPIWTDTLSTNIPTTSGHETGSGVIATNSGGAAALLDMDYMALWLSQAMNR